jgi:putative sigma-54 modulation protein
MTTVHHSPVEPKFLLRGLHLRLNAATTASIETKAARLFRHEPRIIRVRIDVKREVCSGSPRFAAMGRIELPGPDLTASVVHAVAPAAISLLIDKLDRMLRKRTSSVMRRRTTGDIRLLSPVVARV